MTSSYNLNYARHLFRNYLPSIPRSYPPNATIYHSIYNQSIPIPQSFIMTITPASPETETITPPTESQLPSTGHTSSPNAVAQTPIHDVPDWEIPSTPPRRGFASWLPFSKKPQNFMNQDTAYNIPIGKEEGGFLAGGTGGVVNTGARNGFSGRFNNFMPAHRTYLGMSRKIFLLVLGAVFLCLLALILGLAIGLTKKNSTSTTTTLPLPTNTSHFTGDITYYDPGGPGYGSCGLISYSTSSICAISHIVYDAASTSSNPNNNPLCGKEIRITRFDESVGRNRSIDVKVVDRCVGCKVDDLDLSESVFADLADVGLGRVTASWAWL